ncbi:MAG: GAF domain-containing protein [Campylobacterota bacterium]|nr:GAF domain-containing protein [Campylobacterota bacterium]
MNPHIKLATFGRELLKHHSIEKGIPLISSYAKELSGAQRCSIYIYNSKLKVLWTTISDGVEKIMLDADQGIAGQTVREARSIIENDPYNNPNFNPKIDRRTGFVTKNIASIPIFDSSKKVIGALQLLNKEEGFTKDEVRLMVFFAHYISGYLELSTFFDDEQEYLLQAKK